MPGRVCLGRSDSFPRGGLTWELFIFTWELFRLCEAKLFVHEAKLYVLVLLGLAIFPSFLIVSKFSLFNCLSLTLLAQTGHTTNQNNFQIIGREGQNLARNIKESIYIRVNNPSLNNSIGKFNLSHIWDRVLLNTNGLSLK